MNPITDLLSSFDKLITEHGSATILKERIVQLREEFERLKEKHDRLEIENQRLKCEVDDLRKALEQKTISHEYTEHRGVLFRRLANGQIQDEVYCPSCKVPMTSLMGHTPLRCSKCHFTANFTGRDIERVVKEVAT